MKNKIGMMAALFVVILLGVVIYFLYDKMNQKEPEKEAKKSELSSKEIEEDTKEVKKEENPKDTKEKEEKPSDKDEKSEIGTEEKKPDEKEENKDEKPKTKEDKNPLGEAKKTGEYWVMMNYSVTEKEGVYEVTGDVYDAKVYSDWVDTVGSDGVDEEEANLNSGLIKEKVTFLIKKDRKVEADKLEGFEIEEKTLEEFWEGQFGTFLFDNRDEEIIKILDWYMNYSG